jgi:hypothetical protein
VLDQALGDPPFKSHVTSGAGSIEPPGPPMM